MQKIEKANLSEWLAATAEASRGSHYPALYKKVHRMLSIPSRSRGAVSIQKINSNTKEGDNIIVPRKVLSAGKLDHKISIAALEYSKEAEKALRESGSSVVGIKEMVSKQKISIIV